jgi:hypothetical protein
MARKRGKEGLWSLVVVLSSALAFWAVPARGQEATSPAAGPRKGVVLRIEQLSATDYELLVDMGKKDGLGNGDRVNVFSRVTLVHPVTRKKVEDLLPVGEATVSSVGERMSTVSVGTARPDRFKVGDVVAAASKAPAEPQPACEISEQALVCPECKEDPEAQALHEAWLDTVGRSVVARQATWGAFLALNPETRFKTQVEAELKWLDDTDALLRRRSEPPAPKVSVRHDALTSVVEGARVRVAVTLESTVSLRRVRVFFRRLGDAPFDSLVMNEASTGYYQADLPQEMTGAKGAIEYFVEAETASGQRVTLIRDAGTPLSVAVEPPAADEPDRAGRCRVSTQAEWADFYLTDPGRDHFWRIEGDLRYTLDLGFLDSFRMGFGVFQGEGGPAEFIEKKQGDPARLVVNYVYFETALALGTDRVTLNPRLVVGDIGDNWGAGEGEPDPLEKMSRDSGDMFGAHLYLRIGREDETNLLLGGSLTSEMGNEAIIKMNLALLDMFPMGVSAVATSFPVGDDYAARLIYELGWRPSDWLEVSGQFGVNMRNIRHIGIGGGFGLAVLW